MELLGFQVLNFALSIATGFFVGVLFDIYRGLWIRLSPPRITRPLLDMIWWMVVTLFVFLILLWCTWGEVRFYLFLGQVIGFFSYQKKASSTFLNIFARFLFWLEKSIKTFIRMVLAPLRILKKIIFWPFALISICLYKVMRFLKKAAVFVKKVFRVLPRKVGKKIKKLFSKK